MYEHARGAIPRRDHGYCVDDVARGLVVLAREPELSAELTRLLERYCAFIAHAQTGTGSFHNRLGFDRRWHDTGGSGDWWGRALWGLGSVIAGVDVPPWVRREALTCFEASVGCRSESRRAMAFAALGAAEVLRVDPSHGGACSLLAAAVSAIGRPQRDPSWPWPEERLFYANAVFADVLLAAGKHLGEESRTNDGLLLLKWLVQKETRRGHLSVTPVGGWSRQMAKPAFDQQPTEVSTLVDACARASEVDGDSFWGEAIAMGVGWFLGANDVGEPLLDSGTAGCSDGLGPRGASLNQGAESTLALVSTLQHGRALRPGGVA